MALTKVDVLDEFESIQVCTEYLIEGVGYKYPPLSCWSKKIQPIYTEFKGWKTDTYGLTDKDSIPKELGEYIEFIQDYIGVPITILSTGPDRNHTLFLK